MRRTILIAGLLCGAIFLIVNALIGYAYFNLATLVERNQKRILARLTDEIGRPIQVDQIQARRGWVVSLTVRGLKIGDDPAFSQLPFVLANQVTVHLRFWPLLRGKAKITDVEVTRPEIRLLRSKEGDLNLESLGASRAGTQSAPAAFGMESLTVTDGTILYRDVEGKAAAVEVRHVDLHVSNLDFYKPFGVRLKLALLSDRQNVDVSGRLGPLIRERVFQASRVPLDLKLGISNLNLDRLRTLADFAAPVLSRLFIYGPLTLSGTITGEFGKPSFALRSDLSPNRVRYGTVFDKAGGVAMVLAFTSRTQAAVRTASAALKLADLELTAGGLAFDQERLRARLDTNSFDLTTLSHALPLIASYGLFGKAEVHGLVQFVNGRPDADGIVKLTQAGAAPRGAKIPAFSEFTAAVQFAHNRVAIPHTDFAISGARASLEARADSITPLKASYTFGADSLKLAEFLPGRPPREALNRLKISGDAHGSFAAPNLNVTVKSADGTVADLDYRDLDLTAVYTDDRLSAQPLKLAVFGGSLSANGNILFEATPQFDFALKMNRLNAEQLLRWGRLDAARMLRGRLTGNVRIAGRGAKWGQIEPTLRGNGRLAIADGKLVGVNIVAVAINTLAGAPGINQLINAAFLSSHRGMLVNPDTELTHASLSFDLQGPRVTTHDLNAQSEFYSLRGDGWFDMDSNIDMSMDVELSFGLSVALPVVVRGKWPSVLVLPDIPKLTERLALGALGLPKKILKGGASALQRLLP